MLPMPQKMFFPAWLNNYDSVSADTRGFHSSDRCNSLSLALKWVGLSFWEIKSRSFGSLANDADLMNRKHQRTRNFASKTLALTDLLCNHDSKSFISADAVFVITFTTPFDISAL